MKENRQQGLAALNSLFRGGHPLEPPLAGPYRGELVAADIAPVATQFVEGLTALWMPWKGKHLSPGVSQGDDIFGQGSRLALRLMFQFYRGVKDNDADTFRAFVFKTSIAAGSVDPDRQVFRIHYNSPDNPALTIRRLEIKPGVYLGKIHFKWWWASGRCSAISPGAHPSKGV